MYDIKKTLSKGASEGGTIAIVAAVTLRIGVVVADKLAGIGVDVEPVWVQMALLSGAAAAVRGGLNWWKHRNRRDGR
jgi:hypothetical protein